jgi:hypothetical protein
LNNLVRKDIVFESEREAAKFLKFTRSNPCIESFNMTESDLGYLSSPFLSEAEMMYIMTNYKGVVKNIMQIFDGKVEQDSDGKIFFKFTSLASVNLFLHILAGPDTTALGLLQMGIINQQTRVLQCVVQGKSEAFRIKIAHSVPRNSKRLATTKRENGWNWDLLAMTCDFVLERGGTKSTKILMFKSKFNLFKFLTGITAKLFDEVKLDNIC